MGTGNIAPTLGFIPLGDNRPSTYSIGDEYKLNSDLKSQSKIIDSYKKLPSQSPTNKPRRSLTNPDSIIEIQKKLMTPKANAQRESSHSRSGGSFNDDSGKHDLSPKATGKTEKSLTFEKKGILASLRKLGSKTQITFKEGESALELISGRKNKADDDNLDVSPKTHLIPKAENKLLNLILKHASSGNLSKEAEIFNKVMVFTLYFDLC